MSILLILAKNLHRRNDVITSLLFSLDIILIINLYNIENVGMWLSFLGTFGLVKLNLKFSEAYEKEIELKDIFVDKKLKLQTLIKFIKILFIKSLKTSLSVNIFIFPIILYVYNTISLTFFISNFLVSFFIGWIIILGYICLFLGKFLKVLVFLENFLLSILFKLSNYIGNIKFSKVYVTTPNIIFFILYYLILMIYLFFKDKLKEYIYVNRNIIILKLKILIKFSFIILLFFILIKNISKKDYIKINFIDVGQGDCSLITTSMKKTILIDGGNNLEYDYGKNVVLPYLLKSGTKFVDYIIISHFDSDHVRTDY